MALAAGAHGVHLRADSMPAARVRAVAPPGFLIGPLGARARRGRRGRRRAGGLDYLMFGTVFATASKPGRAPAGPSALAAVVAAARVPVLAVGGVTPDNLREVAAAGAAGFAAIGMFAAASEAAVAQAVARAASPGRCPDRLMERSPLLDTLQTRRSQPRLRLLAAQGAVAPRAEEQLELLVMLAGDADPEVAATAERTLAVDSRGEAVGRSWPATCRPRPRRASRPRAFSRAARRRRATRRSSTAAPKSRRRRRTRSSSPRCSGSPSLNVAKRIALAMKGNREERAILIRDPNRIVTAAVLSSPKMSDTEVAAIAKMQNVSEDVLRTIANNRAWLKNYSVVLAVVKNPKTPVALSMNLMARLSEKDLKLLSTDRNVPDALRTQARRKMVVEK